MGTWGSSVFQNDSASDCLAELREKADVSVIQKALIKVVKQGGTKYSPPSILERLRGLKHHIEWLIADDAAKALAAAEIVAAWSGHPSADLPEETLVWLSSHPNKIQAELIVLAKQAVEIVKSNSELKDLWEEGDATEWKNAVGDLERRLNLPPSF